MSTRRTLVVDLVAESPTWSLPAEGVQAIRDAAPEAWQVRFVAAASSNEGDGRGGSAEAVAAVRDAEVYFGFGISPTVLEAGKTLRWIHSAAAGVGSALSPELREREVLFTNSAGVHAIPIAEYVIGGVLHFLRGFDIALEQQRSTVWDTAPFVGAGTQIRELGDCRALIIGTGGVGQAVASRLSAFGCRPVGVRRRPELGAPPGFARAVGTDSLDLELPSADLLVLAAPLTVVTRGLMTATRLEALPQGAILVNVARGALLDEEALAASLARRRLRGAVLDVFDEEPLRASSPLWRLGSVLLTPHVSAVSPRGYWQRELSLFLANWRRYRRDEPLRNVVDKRAGY